MPTWGLTYWPYFLITIGLIFIIGFLPPEIYALITNPSNTLSDYSWHELDVSVAWNAGKHTLAWWLSLITFCTGISLLITHIWFRSI